MKHHFLLLLFLLPSMASYGFVAGGSNFRIPSYPSQSCTKPYKPVKPYTFQGQWHIDSYNFDVEQYNSELEDYFDCIEEYVDNAENDIKRIKQAMEEAVTDTEYLP